MAKEFSGSDDIRFDPTERGMTADQVNLADRAKEEIGACSKIKRFTNGKDDPRDAEQQRQRKSVELQLTALQQLLLDAEYRAAYQRVGQSIGEVQSKLDAAILENAAEIDRLESEATKLDNGTIIFLAANGKFYTAEGQRTVSEPLPSNVSPAAPTWEEYQAAKQRAAELAEVQTEIVDPARARLQDQDSPPELDELGEIESKIRNAERVIDGTAAMTAGPNKVQPSGLDPSLGVPSL